MAIDHRPFGRDRAAHERAIDDALRTHGVEVVCLAGYLRLLTPWLVVALGGPLAEYPPEPAARISRGWTPMPVRWPPAALHMAARCIW